MITVKKVNTNKKTFVSPRQSNLEKYYGKLKEQEKYQIIVPTPYPMKASWDNNLIISNLKIHNKVEQSVLNIFNDIKKAYDNSSIVELGLDQFGGAFNFRKKRGAENEPDNNIDAYSTHSWGIAFDLYPQMNKLRWGPKRAVFSKDEYLEFWKIVYKHGGVSLGLEAGYDYMHVQFLQLDEDYP